MPGHHHSRKTLVSPCQPAIIQTSLALHVHLLTAPYSFNYWVFVASSETKKHKFSNSVALFGVVLVLQGPQVLPREVYGRLVYIYKETAKILRSPCWVHRSGKPGRCSCSETFLRRAISIYSGPSFLPRRTVVSGSRVLWFFCQIYS